ncbi:MAG: tetratricopeptide repeat protein [bacterium]
MKNKRVELSNAVQKLMEKGNYEKAYPLCVKLMKLVSASEGPTSRETAMMHNRLGLCLQAKDKKLGEKELRKAIKILDKNEDWAQSVEKSICLQNLADVMHAIGRYEECDELLIQAAVLRKALTQPDSYYVTALLQTFGNVTVSDESTEEFPQKVANRVIWLAEYMYGTGHLPCVALEQMVDLYEPDDDQREVAYHILLYIKRRYLVLFGQFSQPYANIGYRLAPYFDSKGDKASAVQCCYDELRIQERLHEPDIDRFASCLNHLAAYQMEDGQVDEAEALLSRLLSLLRKDDPKSTHLPDILDRLATIHLNRSEYAKAVSEEEEAVAITRKIKGDKAGLLERLYHLGNLYEQQGKYSDAKTLDKALSAYKETLRLAERVHGKRNEFYPEVLNCMANVCSTLKIEKEAIDLYERSLSIRRTALGAGHPSVGETMNDLALVYLGRKDYKKAEGLLRKALSILEAAHGAEGQQLTPILNNLGLTLTGKGEPVAAIPQLERAVRIAENANGPDSPELIHYLRNLGGFWALAGKPVEAEQVYRRAILIAGNVTPGQSGGTKDLQNELQAIKAGTFNERTAAFIHVEAGG